MTEATRDRAADVLIVGAGAAGLATAIFAAPACAGRRVVALDGVRSLGAKILVAGGGRCNVTNSVVTPADYWGGSRHVIGRVLAAFGVAETVAWFAGMGVPLHEEEHGKLFPDSNQARTVLSALLARAAAAGAEVLADRRVMAVQRRDGGFAVTTSIETWTARRLVLATGGLSLPKTGSDGAGYAFARQLGHSLIPTTPALEPLLLDSDWHAALSGISQDVELTIGAEGTRPVHLEGALLWTHFGISGPVVLNAARHWQRAQLAGHPATITANFLPGHDFARAEQMILELASEQPRLALRTALSRWLPARVGETLLAATQLDGGVALAHLERQRRRHVIQALLAWPLPVVGGRGYKYAEVTAGGVPLTEINPATMESRCCPGLHLVGEILDIDGRIGGFNFQWAWSSARVASCGLGEAGPSSAD